VTGPKGRIDPDSGTELASQDRLRELYRASEMSSLPAEPVPVPDLTRYGLEIEGLLGKGGMGTVYRARQQRPARTVAVKVLTGGGLRDAELRQRFEREIHALSSLASPYIVPIYDTGSTPDGSPFYVMELVEGTPLEQYASENHLTTGDRLRLLAKVCEGVQAAHRLAIIHRDLKPSNILVDGHGRPRILDLGLAKFQERDTRDWATISQASQIMGTPAFMAPEQFQAESAAVDTRADCYSLGVLLYRLVLEAPPYPAADGILATMHIVCTANPVPPRELVPHLPRDLAAILMKALEKPPDHRYQSPQALGDDISRFLAGRPVEAQLPTTWYKISKFLSRNRLSTSIAFAATLLATALAGVSVWRIKEARTQAESALRAERETRQELAREAYLNSLPAISERLRDRDYARAASMLGQAPLRERSWEWQRLAYRTIPWQITLGAGRELTALAKVSDNTCVTGNAAGALTIWDLRGGKPIRTWTGHNGRILQVSVSPEGNALLSADQREAKLWDLQTQQLTLTVPFTIHGVVGSAVAPRFAPHGLLLIPGTDEIQFLTRDGNVRMTVPLRGPLTLCASSPRNNMVAWSESYRDATEGGFLNVSALQSDGALQARFSLRYAAHGFAVSDDALRLAIAGTSETRVKEFDTDNFSVISQGRADGVFTFLPGSHRLLSGSARGLELLTPEDGGKEPQAQFLTRSPPRAVFPLGKGDRALILDHETLHVLDTCPTPAPIIRGPAVGSAWQLSPDGQFLAIIDETLSVHDTSTGRSVRDLGRSAPGPTILSFSSDNRGLATARLGFPHVTIHDLAAGTRQMLAPCPQSILAMTTGNTHQQVAAITTNSRIYLHDGSTGAWQQAAPNLRVRRSPPLLRFDAQGERLAVGTVGGGLAIIDAQSGDCSQEFPGANYQDMAFSPNGRWLLMAGFGTAALWDATTNQIHGTLQPFTAMKGKRALRFAPDSRRILVGERNAVSIWDVESCRKLVEEPIPLAAATDGGFRADGCFTVLGPTGALVRLHAAPSTAALPASLEAEKARAWRREASSRTVPDHPISAPVACFLGLGDRQIPGTPEAHAGEQGAWEAQGTHVVVLPAPELPGDEVLARIDVLRICLGPRGRVSKESRERIGRWIAAGGRLFLTGTSEGMAEILASLGLPRPGAIVNNHIPASLPGTLPLHSPTGAYRLLHATRFRPVAGDSPCLCQIVGNGLVIAILADKWCCDAPDPTDGSRCYLGRGDNRLILQDCIRRLTARTAAAGPGHPEVDQ